MSCRGHRHLALHSRCLCLRPASTSAASNLAGPGVRGRGHHPDRRLSSSLRRRKAQSERPCLVASGEASGFERLGLPPQVGPQPTYPVRQSIARHREVGGDNAVVPAVYDPALQQGTVAYWQIQE